MQRCRPRRRRRPSRRQRRSRRSPHPSCAVAPQGATCSPALYRLPLVQTTFDAGDGRILSYLRRGSGPLVVCLPGGPGMDPEAYFAAMELPGYELLIFAPRGTGASTPPPTKDGYKIAGYVEDLEALRVHLGVDTLTLYGNSHGGCMSLAYACMSPERVARLVVTNAPPRMDDPYQAAAAEVPAPLRREIRGRGRTAGRRRQSKCRTPDRYRRGRETPTVPHFDGPLRCTPRTCGSGVPRPPVRGADELGLRLGDVRRDA